tara:strand:- start:223 stop:345 length:123 start_codon:yes stop_codon:yes gene_type:complete
MRDSPLIIIILLFWWLCVKSCGYLDTIPLHINKKEYYREE